MYFDAEAYASGICEHAAGSTIEVLVMTIDSTVQWLDTHAEDMIAVDEEDKEEKDELRRLSEQWSKLREAIVRRERENGEDTVFPDDDEEDEGYEEDEDERYTVEMDVNTGNYVILDGGVEREDNVQYGTLEEAEDAADHLNATD
jgi:hypothetical protein